MATQAVKQLQLAPLGAGDLIDRTVRLYRRHFMALVRASAPPVFVSSAGAILMTISLRAMKATTDFDRILLYMLLVALGFSIDVLGRLAQLVILGGASRNLVMNLLWDEPVTATLIYRSVRSRFWKLTWAVLAVGLWLVISYILSAAAFLILFFVGLMLVGIMTAAGAGGGGPDAAQWVALIILLVVSVAGAALMFFLFFLLAGQAAYVPQVLMVEGRGVFDSISRSVELARGHVRRLAAMFLFTTFATWAAVALLLAPLGWFGYLSGINPYGFILDPTRLPAWFAVSRDVITQFGSILLAPVYMMGLSLLYVDQRVRREGYDIELMSAQRFGEMPTLPTGVRAPVAPALAAPEIKQPREEEKFKSSVLGL